MSTTLLRETGEALYGPRWQTDIAKALGVQDRTVRRWVANDDPLPPDVIVDLQRLCDERIERLTVIRARLIGREHT